jgi:pimeloyl-ACP methyl ester carboxylesterase
MAGNRRTLAFAGAAGLAAGIVAERLLVTRRRREDTETDEPFGKRRGVRSKTLQLDDGASIFIEEFGPKRATGVVFVHGSAMRTDLWHYQMADFEGRRLVFYDLRGHGLSQPKGKSDYEVATLAGDLSAIIDDAKLDEVVVVGHSIGGMVALELCCQRPDLLGSRLKGIVLANSTYRPPIETIAGGAAVARLERAARRPMELLGGRASYIDRVRRVVKPSDALFWGVSFAAFGPNASAVQVDFTYDMLAATASDVIFDLFKAYRGFDVRDRLSEVTVPVLAIAGSHDRLTVPEASEYLVQHLPKAQLEILEGCGHMSMLEHHAEFNELVERFLRDTLGASTTKPSPRRKRHG